jgi:Flp pilus assembly pilin Flp
MRQLFNRFIKDTRGVSALEYAVAVGATALNGNLTTLFANLNKSVAAAAKTAG